MIFFNHLYLVLPDKTYRAITGSEFLRIAFPGMEHRSTNTAAGESWSGTYYYCRDNYIEFFPASAGYWQDTDAEGWGGLAFSSDDPDGADAVARAIQSELGYEPYHILRKLQVGEQTFNWFYYVRLVEQVGLPSFDAWVMEYHPDIFPVKGIPIPSDKRLTRQAYLSPMNRTRLPEKGKLVPAPPVFSRLTCATLRMEPVYALRFARVLALFGYTQTNEDGILTLSSPDFCLRFLPEEPGPNRFRVRSLTLQLARPSVAPTTLIFAPGSRLELREDNTAEWFFGE